MALTDMSRISNFLALLALCAAQPSLTHGADAASPNPYLIASPDDLKERIAKQLFATKPDYVVFVPQVAGNGVSDTGNEHFLVFDGPDGSLMAVWTQKSIYL